MEMKIIEKTKEDWEAIARGLLVMHKHYSLTIHEEEIPLDATDVPIAIDFIANLAIDLLKK